MCTSRLNKYVCTKVAQHTIPNSYINNVTCLNAGIVLCGNRIYNIDVYHLQTEYKATHCILKVTLSTKLYAFVLIKIKD